MAGKEQAVRAPAKKVKKRRPPSAAAKAQLGGEGPRPKRRRRRHGRMTLNYLLFGILGLIVLMLLCYFVFFKVYKITVTGDTGSYSEQQIIEVSGIEMHDSLFSVDQKEVYTGVVGSLPYVQAVVVHKKFPTTVELEVTLSKPVGAVLKDNQYLYINTDGRILESGLMDYNRSYPRILGINAISTEAGSYVLNQNSEQIVMLKRVLTAIENSGLDKINLISVADRLNIRIMYDERLLIELGTEADLDWKLQFIRASIESNISSTAKAVLDASMLDEIGRVFYREERDLYAILEQEAEQEATDPSTQVPAGDAAGDTSSASSGSSSSGLKFQVDPQTGDIIVGLQDPLNSSPASSAASSSGAGSSSAADGSSSSGSGSSSAGAASSSSGSSSAGAASSSSSSSGAAGASSSPAASGDSSASSTPSEGDKDSSSSKAVIGPAAPRKKGSSG